MSKTGEGLVNFAKHYLGNPYWWGGYGQIASQSLLSQLKSMYPKVYSQSMYSDASSQFGKRVFDCVGLIKAYRWCETVDSNPVYVASQDVAVSGLYNQCNKRGNLSSMPDIPGTCVFMNDMSHVGVYIGGGDVIEARGHLYGVVLTKLKDRGWSLWGRPNWIDYSMGDHPFERLSTADQKIVRSWPALRRGSTGVFVKVLQTLLNYYYKSTLEVDGNFGPETQKALYAYQKEKGLEVDGVAGDNTWASFFVK